MGSPPTLRGERVTLRAGLPAEAGTLHAMMAEPSVAPWWGPPDPVERIEAQLRGDDDETLLVIDVDAEVAGGIYFHEEPEAMYRHASIDIFLSTPFQGRGLGADAVRTLARYLVRERGHHRLTIDPAAANERAIRCYARVGFRPVGVMRRYERGPDGTFHDGLLMDLLAEELSPGGRPDPGTGAAQ